MYLSNGQEIVVVNELADGGFLVRPILVSCATGEEVEGPLAIVGQVFHDPPDAKLNESVAALQKQIEALLATKQSIEVAIATLQEGHAERLAKFRQHKALQRLEDFLDGKLTHYVVERGWGGLQIVNREEYFCAASEKWCPPRALKLLCLFGDSKGTLEWRINEYKDGSGSNTTVVPCTSYEEAIQEAKDILNARFLLPCARMTTVESADKLGIPVPLEYRDRAVAHQWRGHEDRIAACLKQIADENAQLSELARQVGKAWRPSDLIDIDLAINGKEKP